MTNPVKNLAGRLSGATRQQHALRVERQAAATLNPTVALLFGVGRKAVGLAAFWWGQDEVHAASKVQGLDKYVTLALGVLVLLVGLVAIMPDVSMTVMRFLGLGGLVDKVLRRKERDGV